MNHLKYGTIAVGSPGSLARFKASFQDLLNSGGEWLKPDLSNLDPEYLRQIAADQG